MDYIKDLIEKNKKEEEDNKTLIFILCAVLLLVLLGGVIYLIFKKRQENELSVFDEDLEDEEVYDDEFDESDHHSVYIDLRKEDNTNSEDA
ncbi:MAG: hypothetical protein IJ791_00905 [Lachnospiraceae bacterium]|nr:hypothetical protein [Lachnospiraceae bacterium]